MTLTAPINDHGYDPTPHPVPPLPDGPLTGPATRSATRRLVAGLAVWVALWSVVGWFTSGALRTFALGLVFPGGGFVNHLGDGAGSDIVHVGLVLMSLFLMLVAYLTWVGTGNLIGVPIMLTLLAGLASAMGGSMGQWQPARVVVPALTVAAGLLASVMVTAGHARAARRRPVVNAMLERATPTTVVTATAADGLPVVEELSPQTLALQRFLLDRALQPIDEFNGYDKLDQFREGAPRYQTCLSSYALSMQTYAHTPAFTGYLAEGQHRFGLKMQQHHVWGYWRLENFWGRLHLDPDPIAVNNNIMYSGWYAAMLTMLETANRDDSFSQPGSIELKHPNGSIFTYDMDSLCDNLAQNFDNSSFTLFPCEPGWSYPMCNNYGAIALIGHDRLHGSSRWAEREAVFRRQLLEEFITNDGKIVSLRNTHMGISVTPMNSTMPGCMASIYMNGVFPDIARRSYEILRQQAFHPHADGIDVDLSLWDLIDFGNYKPSHFSSYAMLAAAAREHGDDAIADSLLAKAEDDTALVVEDGVGHYPGRSVGAHATAFMARSLRPNTMHDLVQVGLPDAWRRGPILEEATYPDVLVARAVSDGEDLSLTLDPGRPGGLRSRLGLGQLVAGSTYQVEGAVEATVTADVGGRARINVDLAGRTRIHLVPAGV